MGSREDDAHWDNKYAEFSCWDHGMDNVWFDEDEAEWVCLDCEGDDSE